jgi:hypothetical protein
MPFIAARPVDEHTTKPVEQQNSSNFGACSVKKAMNDLSAPTAGGEHLHNRSGDWGISLAESHGARRAASRSRCL